MYRLSRAAALGLFAVGGAALLKHSGGNRGAGDSAPGRTARKSRFGDYAVVGKTVTIAKPPRDRLFAFWRDFTNLPAFMDNLERIEVLGPDRSRWTIKGPGEPPSW